MHPPLHDVGDHGYGTRLTVVRQGRRRHGDRTAPVEAVTEGWEIAPEGASEDDDLTRDVTTTRLRAYGGPERPPDIRPDDRVWLDVDTRTRRGKPLEPPWQVEGVPDRWGPALSVVTLRRVDG